MAWWGWLLLGIFIGANCGVFAIGLVSCKGGSGRRKGDVIDGGDSKESGEIG